MTMKIHRGDIFYANLDGAIGSEQKSKRPVVIVQNNIGNKYANTVIAVPLTKKIDGRTKLPMHITVRAFGKIKMDSTLLTEQIRILDKTRLLRKMGKLPSKMIIEMDKALKIALGLN